MPDPSPRDPVSEVPVCDGGSGSPASAIGSGRDGRGRPRRLVGPIVCAGVLALGAAALHVRDPHAGGSWGACPLLALTGLACPLCGGMRATNDLTNGQVARAFWSNALFVTALPLLALWWIAVFRDRWRGSLRSWNRPLQVRGVMPAVLVVAVAFTVVRNTPWGARLYP